ncbi:MAG: hypothetical protein NVS1B11_20210 [Terriglobales bacterium]
MKRSFRLRLLKWYDVSRRDLPWRHSRAPYRVWLSEIMLQQTRVAAAIEYYQRFLIRFPTIDKLAAAREASVLAAWSGLGYYRRARQMHLAAKMIVRELGGKFPANSESLGELPGIGRYTSAAIASIVFGEPIATVDGNVERVLQRITGKSLLTSQIWTLAAQLVCRKRPGDFNQAMMELGALVCLPRNPLCACCPVSRFCRTRGDLKVKRKIPPQRKEEIQYGLGRRGNAVFLVQRSLGESLMPGMWELPQLSNDGAKCDITLRHSITVTNYLVRVAKMANIPNEIQGKWVANSQLEKIALTGLARKILRAAKIV